MPRLNLEREVADVHKKKYINYIRKRFENRVVKKHVELFGEESIPKNRSHLKGTDSLNAGTRKSDCQVKLQLDIRQGFFDTRKELQSR